jgi:Rad3-related DNA helicase
MAQMAHNPFIETTDIMINNHQWKSYEFDGLQVPFRHRMYDPQQTSIASAIVHALHTRNRKSGVIINSPTGTGKSAIMFSTALAYQREMRPESVKVIYVSRTHAQLEQAASELRESVPPELARQFRMVTAAARKHLCNNSDVCCQKNVDDAWYD